MARKTPDFYDLIGACPDALRRRPARPAVVNDPATIEDDTDEVVAPTPRSSSEWWESGADEVAESPVNVDNPFALGYRMPARPYPEDEDVELPSELDGVAALPTRVDAAALLAAVPQLTMEAVTAFVEVKYLGTKTEEEVLFSALSDSTARTAYKAAMTVAAEDNNEDEIARLSQGIQEKRDALKQARTARLASIGVEKLTGELYLESQRVMSEALLRLGIDIPANLISLAVAAASLAVEIAFKARHELEDQWLDFYYGAPGAEKPRTALGEFNWRKILIDALFEAAETLRGEIIDFVFDAVDEKCREQEAAEARKAAGREAKQKEQQLETACDDALEGAINGFVTNVMPRALRGRLGEVSFGEELKGAGQEKGADTQGEESGFCIEVCKLLAHRLGEGVNMSGQGLSIDSVNAPDIQAAIDRYVEDAVTAEIERRACCASGGVRYGNIDIDVSNDVGDQVAERRNLARDHAVRAYRAGLFARVGAAIRKSLQGVNQCSSGAEEALRAILRESAGQSEQTLTALPVRELQVASGQADMKAVRNELDRLREQLVEILAGVERSSRGREVDYGALMEASSAGEPSVEAIDEEDTNDFDSTGLPIRANGERADDDFQRIADDNAPSLQSGSKDGGNSRLECIPLPVSAGRSRSQEAVRSMARGRRWSLRNRYRCRAVSVVVMVRQDWV